jgi:antitoxin HicB
MARAKAFESESYTYTVVFEPDEETGGYTVTCPALPGLVTEGDTLEEARAMAADAIKGYLESLRKHGHPIPPGEVYETEPIREPVTVRLEQG